MSTEKYLVEVDFESPLLSNSVYGVNLGVMRLITGDVNESHFGSSFVAGLLPKSNLRIPKNSYNMSAGGGVSVSASGSLTVSNIDDFYGFLQENSVYWTYKFCTIWSVSGGTPKLEFKGIISSGAISASTISFTIASRLNRDLRRIPDVIDTGLFYGSKLDDKATKSSVVWQKVPNVNVNQPEGSTTRTPLFNMSKSEDIFNGNPLISDYFVNAAADIAGNIDTLILNSDTVQSYNTFIGDWVYNIAGRGNNYLSQIVESKHWTFDPLVNRGPQEPKDLLKIDPPISRTTGAFIATDNFKAGYSDKENDSRTELYTALGAQQKEDGTLDSIDIETDNYSNLLGAVTINEPLNPSIADLNSENYIYAPKYFLAPKEEVSGMLILSNPASHTLQISDTSVDELDEFNGINVYDNFLSFTPGNNFVLYERDTLGKGFELECWQRLGSGSDLVSVDKTTRGLLGQTDQFNNNSLGAVAIYQEYSYTGVETPDDFNTWSSTYSYDGLKLLQSPGSIGEGSIYYTGSRPFLGDKEDNFVATANTLHANYLDIQGIDIRQQNVAHLFKQYTSTTRKGSDSRGIYQGHTSRTVTQFTKFYEKRAGVFDYDNIDLSFGFNGEISLYSGTDASPAPTAKRDLGLFLRYRIVAEVLNDDSDEYFTALDTEYHNFGICTLDRVDVAEPLYQTEYYKYHIMRGRNTQKTGLGVDTGISTFVDDELDLSDLNDFINDPKFLKLRFQVIFEFNPQFRTYYDTEFVWQGVHSCYLNNLDFHAVNKSVPEVVDTELSLGVTYETKWKGLLGSVALDPSAVSNGLITEVIPDLMLGFDDVVSADIGTSWDAVAGIPKVSGSVLSVTDSKSVYNSLLALGPYAMYSDRGIIKFKDWLADIGDGLNLTETWVFDESNIIEETLKGPIQRSPNEIYNEIIFTYTIAGVATAVHINGSLDGPFPLETADWQAYAKGMTDYELAKQLWGRLNSGYIRSRTNRVWTYSTDKLVDATGVNNYLLYVTGWHTWQKLKVKFSVPNRGNYALLDFVSVADQWITGLDNIGDPRKLYGWISSMGLDTIKDQLDLEVTLYIDPSEICQVGVIDEGTNEIVFTDNVEEGIDDEPAYPDSINQDFSIDCA